MVRYMKLFSFRVNNREVDKFTQFFMYIFYLFCFQVIQSASQLAQLAWIKSQQRINLDRLILAKPDCSPDVCCLRANTLDQTQFIDAYKVLGYQVGFMMEVIIRTMNFSCKVMRLECEVIGNLPTYPLNLFMDF